MWELIKATAVYSAWILATVAGGGFAVRGAENIAIALAWALVMMGLLAFVGYVFDVPLPKRTRGLWVQRAGLAAVVLLMAWYGWIVTALALAGVWFLIFAAREHEANANRREGEARGRE